MGWEEEDDEQEDEQDGFVTSLPEQDINQKANKADNSSVWWPCLLLSSNAGGHQTLLLSAFLAFLSKDVTKHCYCQLF